MLRKFLYTGPSWAANSYPIDENTTNLAQQWGFDYIEEIQLMDCNSDEQGVLYAKK